MTCALALHRGDLNAISTMKKLVLNFAFFLLLQSGHVTPGSALPNQGSREYSATPLIKYRAIRVKYNNISRNKRSIDLWDLILCPLLLVNTCGDTCRPLDCSDVFDQGQTSDGAYLIYPGGVSSPPVPVYCDMTTNGGPWTVFQKRFDGSVDFYRDWKEYKNGFGHANGEYWLGLQNIHLLTQKRSYRLRVDLEDFGNDARYGTYDTFALSPFAIDPEEDGYKLHIGAFKDGDPNKPIGDSLRTQNQMTFSTHDKDTDRSKGNCAATFRGASWYNACHMANLNGLYLKGKNDQYGDGITWKTWMGQHYSMKSCEMKIAIKV